MKYHKVYIKLYTNKVVVCDLKTTKCVERKGNFSDERIVFADYEIAEKLIKECLDELFPKKMFSFYSFKFLIHQLERSKGGISKVEERAILDSSTHLNASSTKIICVERNCLWMKL